MRKKGKKEESTKMMSGCVAILLGTAFLCALSHAMSGGETDKKGNLFGKMSLWMEESVEKTYLPVFAFIEGETGIHKEPEQFFKEIVLSAMPVYQYSEDRRKGVPVWKIRIPMIC